MPWTQKQHNLFEAVAHNASIAKAHHMSQADARRMASEGVKGKRKKRRGTTLLTKHVMV